MKKEELLSIGLTEEQADKVFAMNGKDIEKHKKAAEDAKASSSVRRCLTQQPMRSWRSLAKRRTSLAKLMR